MRNVLLLVGVIAVGLVAQASRAEAQTACGYGQTCVVVVGAAPSGSGLGSPVAPVMRSVELEESVERRPRWGLLITGLGMFVGGYVFSIVLDDIDDDIGWGAVPLAGPFVSMTEGWNVLAAPLFVVSGALQIAGAVMAIVGAAAQVEVPTDDVRGDDVVVAPYASAEGAGVGVAGRW